MGALHVNHNALDHSIALPTRYPLRSLRKRSWSNLSRLRLTYVIL